jgi:hypothetical protein|tara:strand:- start:298 stop:528 length:231 start_codon:yes stop_codon:yes gene_type:complete
MGDITRATFNWGNRQHPNTKGKKMKTKELKEQLWQAYYTAKNEDASRKVTNAILDVMIMADKEAEEKSLEKTKVCS